MHYHCFLHIALSLAIYNARIHPRKRTEHVTESGLRAWVDSDTPEKDHFFINSRGQKWELVMSDEFNTPGRSFKPGEDHMWTSIEKPDGVNHALELYSHNLTTTNCDEDDRTCYFQIAIVDEINQIQVWNNYRKKPGYENVTFYYRAGMVQSWNKFCFQGGMLEVRAKLPGIVDKDSGNPDLARGPSTRVKALEYYPTWPGIWMLGNLGRAIFSSSTNRIWPFSYDACDNAVFESSNQRISACDGKPGFGLNPHQGRGAPEIDLLEGAADYISASIQAAPGMPKNYRRYSDGNDCVYTATCPLGGNDIEVPTELYRKKRGHRSWYQGLKYAANNFCRPEKEYKQSYSSIKRSIEGVITASKCDLDICPASYDLNGDISAIPNHDGHWGINTNGTCFARLNPYFGSFLCNPGNSNEYCEDNGLIETNHVKRFAYQMDAISANWPLHVGVYTDYLTYQLEWVMGESGYVRWELEHQPLFEIPATAITHVPQDASKSNPRKIMVEEPMYIIFNVALSSTWKAKPPNAGIGPCRGNGTDTKANKICDAFPLHMKIDYIRLYQNTSSKSSMSVGCDPPTHPTKKWIDGHIEEYQDKDNMWIPVRGKAFCTRDEDCTVQVNISAGYTGLCIDNRCRCSTHLWTGPRCVQALSATTAVITFGPSFSVQLTLAAIVLITTFISMYYSYYENTKRKAECTRDRQMKSVAPYALVDK